MSIRKQHFVKFYSPGTLVSEQSVKPIESWDTVCAIQLSNGIKERYDATPYGFRFTTHIVADAIPDGEGGALEVQPKQVAVSGMHFLGGTLLFYDDIPDDRENDILRSNMRCNGYPIVIENRNSFRSTLPFDELDFIVDTEGRVSRRGDDSDLVAYRARKAAEFKAERDR